MLRVVKLLGRRYYKVKVIFRSFSAQSVANYRHFSSFLLDQSKLKVKKVDKALLQYVISFMAILGAMCFGTPNTNTQIYTNSIFFKFLK